MTNYHVYSAIKNGKKAAQKETKLVIYFDYRTLEICPEFEVQMLENEISNDNLDCTILKVNDNLPKVIRGRAASRDDGTTGWVRFMYSKQ